MTKTRRVSERDFSSLFRATEIERFSIHPTGLKAVCSVNKGQNYELAMLNLSSGSIRTFLSGDQALLSPTYSPCGELIAYQADFEGNEDYDVYVVDAGGRKRRKVTDGVADNEHPAFSPDGARLAFLSNRESDMENLYVIDLGGKSMTRLTDEPLPISDFAWSPDGETIAYGVGVGDDDYISIVNTRKRKTKKALAKRGVEFGISGYYGPCAFHWSNDGRSLLFTSNEEDRFDIGVLDLASRRRKWLVRSANDKYCPSWSPDGTKLAYLEVQDPDLVLKVREGRRTMVVSQKTGVSRAAGWLPDSSGLVYVNGSSVQPEEVFLARASRRKKLTRFQGVPLPSKKFARPKLVRYRSFDGLRISAMLFVPPGGLSGRGIVLPHGGPEMQSLNFWDQIVQMLVMKGFSVILPNYRGSTGYGGRFLHLHDRDLGGGDLKDTLNAGRFMIRRGFADKDKLGFWGASYGGYMCMLALTKAPEMWAAGVSVVGYFDCETEFENERGFLKAYDISKMGDPKENRELYRDRSPIYFLEHLRAPLLMTASARDVRCPPTESREVARRLREMGKEFEYHEYTDEGHWPRKRKNLKDLYSRSVDFLDRKIES
ncbi:MAG: S9 family peptidase [Methanobacteriota archaeon]|nr:MAG: S9 family peptidase [Euryarchaeota archaeon]